MADSKGQEMLPLMILLATMQGFNQGRKIADVRNTDAVDEVQKEELKKLKKDTLTPQRGITGTRGGQKQTILTSPLGLIGDPSGLQRKTLLGM